MTGDEAHIPTEMVPGRRKKGHSSFVFITGIVLAAGSSIAITYHLVDKGRDALYAQDKAALTQSYAQREKSLADQLDNANKRAAASGQCSTDLSAAIADAAKAKGQYESLQQSGQCLSLLLDQIPESAPRRTYFKERINDTYENFTLAAQLITTQPESTIKPDAMFGVSQRTIRKNVAQLKALLPPSAYPGASASQPYDAAASQPAPASQLTAGPAAAPAQRQGDLRRYVRTPRDNESYGTIHGIIPVKREGDGYF